MLPIKVNKLKITKARKLEKLLAKISFIKFLNNPTIQLWSSLLTLNNKNHTKV